jgi:hypothetical protein
MALSVSVAGESPTRSMALVYFSMAASYLFVFHGQSGDAHTHAIVHALPGRSSNVRQSACVSERASERASA